MKEKAVPRVRILTFHLIISAFVFAAVLSAGKSLSASEFRAFHTKLAMAYPHYREAMFYLRTGNGPVAHVELEQWQIKWADIVEGFAKTPPDIYSDDPDWDRALHQIADISSKGLALAQAGKLKEAGAELSEIRTRLSELRRNNHVVIFSDHVDKANQAFDALFEFRHTPPAFDDTQALDQFRRAVSYVTYAYQQVMDRAPPAYLQDDEFQRLMKQSFHSFSRLWVAIEEKNQRNLINILRELRSSDRMLFLRFG